MGNGRELILRAQKAVERIRSLGRADGPLLESVFAAVLKETTRNRFQVATLVAALTAEFHEVRAAVWTLSADQRAHVRRRALRCLGRETPRAFAVEILGARLADTDPAVRMMAASRAGFLGLTELAGPLRARLIDAHAGVRNTAASVSKYLEEEKRDSVNYQAEPLPMNCLRSDDGRI